MSECGFSHDDGAYVLGALSPDERAAFERHLASCEACARSVRELAGLPGLLARVPVEIVDPEAAPEAAPEPVPDTLLPGLVRRARRTQRRRTWLTAGLVAAAAVIAIGAVGVATLGDDEGTPRAVPSSGPTTAAPVLMTPVGSSPVSGWLSLTSVGWGTRLDLECSYAEEGGHGYAHDDGPPTYTMYVTRTDGSTEQVASWKGLPGKTIHLAAATAADAKDVQSVVVRNGDGAPVLELAG